MGNSGGWTWGYLHLVLIFFSVCSVLGGAEEEAEGGKQYSQRPLFRMACLVMALHAEPLQLLGLTQVCLSSNYAAWCPHRLQFPGQQSPQLVPSNTAC